MLMIAEVNQVSAVQSPKVTGRQNKTIEGWTVLISDELFEKDKAATERALGEPRRATRWMDSRPKLSVDPLNERVFVHFTRTAPGGHSTVTPSENLTERVVVSRFHATCVRFPAFWNTA